MISGLVTQEDVAGDLSLECGAVVVGSGAGGATVAAELAQTRAAVESLRNLLQPPQGAPVIEHRSVPAVQAAGITAVVGQPDLLAWWQGALGELHATVRAQGLHATGQGGGMYASELFQHERGEATVFIPVEGGVRAIGRVTPVTVPAAELAVIGHHGSLSDADLSYATLGSYATRHEISIDGPLREYYLRGGVVAVARARVHGGRLQQADLVVVPECLDAQVSDSCEVTDREPYCHPAILNPPLTG